MSMFGFNAFTDTMFGNAFKVYWDIIGQEVKANQDQDVSVSANTVRKKHRVDRTRYMKAIAEDIEFEETINTLVRI